MLTDSQIEEVLQLPVDVSAVACPGLLRVHRGLAEGRARQLVGAGVVWEGKDHVQLVDSHHLDRRTHPDVGRDALEK